MNDNSSVIQPIAQSSSERKFVKYCFATLKTVIVMKYMKPGNLPNSKRRVIVVVGGDPTDTHSVSV